MMGAPVTMKISSKPALSPRRVRVLGTLVSATTFEGAQEFVAQMVEQHTPGYISCANAYSLPLALERPDYAAMLDKAAFVTADGMPVVWALRLLGHEAERAHNDDLFFACCSRYPGWRHFLVGGRENQPQQVAEALSRRFPGINIVGSHPTPVRPVPPEETEVILEKIKLSAPNIVWVGLGTPSQDEWMSSVIERAGVPMVAVGSSFDLLAGKTKAAPEWMKRAGLQWAFRWSQEPRRLARRYLFYNSKFLFEFACQLLQIALHREPQLGRSAGKERTET